MWDQDSFHSLVPKLCLGTHLRETPFRALGPQSPTGAKQEFRGHSFPIRSLGTRGRVVGRVEAEAKRGHTIPRSGSQLFSPFALDWFCKLRHLMPTASFLQTKEGLIMHYQTEAKPQGWRAVAVFDDRH